MRSAACAARSWALSPAKEDRNTVMAWFQTTSGASFAAAAFDASGAGLVVSAAIASEARHQIARAPAITRNHAGCVQRHKAAQKRLESAVSVLVSSPLTGEE